MCVEDPFSQIWSHMWTVRPFLQLSHTLVETIVHDVVPQIELKMARYLHQKRGE